MITAEKIESVAEVVEYFLRKFPETRSNDDALACMVEIHFNPSLRGRDYCEVRKNRSQYLNFSPETIRRARQKLQAQYSELRAPMVTQIARDSSEEVWHEWAKS